jgi:hypothetical protein
MISKSYYSPSALSEVLTMIAALCGLFIGVTSCYYWDLSGIPFWLVTISTMAALMLSAWLAFGYVLTFDKSREAVTVRSRILGFASLRREYSFMDVQSITMHYDGDAFPFIRVSFTDDARYCFFTTSTAREYRLLVGLFDRPAQISAGAVSPPRA